MVGRGCLVLVFLGNGGQDGGEAVAMGLIIIIIIIIIQLFTVGCTVAMS